MLEQYRCLDLSTEQGFTAGRLLGDMGVDVIKVEPPDGDAARMTGPFYHDEPSADKSLFWAAQNLNKRGITLDIEHAAGKEIFLQLAASTDIIVESFAPGYLDALGLGYEAVKKINPKIILTSITPYGQFGPHKNYRTSDLTSMSMGGIVWLTGDPDRPPIGIGAPQAYYFAGAYAVIATLIALYCREIHDIGQHVDVSIQQSLVATTLNAIPHWTLNRRLVMREGSRRAGLTSTASQKQTWPCADGYVTFTMYGGPRGLRINSALVKWMDEIGMATEYLKNEDWSLFDLAKVSPAEWQQIEKPIGDFFTVHTKAELFHEAAKRGVMLFPVYGFEDLLLEPQLRERGYWSELYQPGMGTLLFPGAAVKCSPSPMEIRRPAPQLGQHNKEIFIDELAISPEHLNELGRKGVI